MSNRPPVKVHLWSGLRAMADGQESVDVQAENVGDILTELVGAFPGLADAIEAGVSVSVDGRIITSGLMEAVQPDSEVFLMQRLKGG